MEWTRILILFTLCSGMIINSASSLSNWLPLIQSNYKDVALKSGLCETSPYLTPQQRDLCKISPYSLVYVILSLRLALGECQTTFEGERWNCSTNSFKVFSDKATKESAYIQSITSAALTHAIVRACSAGNMTTCACAKISSKRKRKINLEDEPWPYSWEWGGCSDNIKYGQTYSKQFTDSYLKEGNTILNDSNSSQDRITLHNNKVGRKLVALKMTTECRCHGVSGTCAVRTCWRSLAPFETIGEEIKKLYDRSAVLVSRKRKKKLRPVRNGAVRKRSIQEHNLVYSERSPDFCVAHPEFGISGVKDRECNRTSMGTQGCHSLCCGRGYNTRIVTSEEQCSCKFRWCCYVECDTCQYTKHVFTCK